MELKAVKSPFAPKAKAFPEWAQLGVPFGRNGMEFTVSENVSNFSESINDFQFQFQKFGNFKIISDSEFLELEFLGYFRNISDFFGIFHI